MELSTPLGYLTYLSEIYKGSGILTPKNVCSQTAASEERHEVNRRLRVLQKPAKNQSSFGIGSLTQTWIVEHQKISHFSFLSPCFRVVGRSPKCPGILQKKCCPSANLGNFSRNSGNEPQKATFSAVLKIDRDPRNWHPSCR